MKRRHLLGGAAAALTGAPTLVDAQTTTAADAQLLQLAAEVRAAAFKAWSNAVERMAAIPMASMAGLAAKAALVVQEVQIGTSAAGSILTESIAADIARLVPAAVQA